MEVIVRVLDLLLNVAWWIIIAQAILSWLLAFNVVSPSNDGVRQIWQSLERLTEPLYRPIRRFMPDFGALDLTPMVVLLLIMVVQNAVLPALLPAQTVVM